ncbi:universal stress protein [Streptacidiphilus jiangxiensis]|uniref:Nucleotide-binding universal stress protein, UspA family n=1 Tax=Streptacidiphilus jiangxiensis TaxID=235985 RepID=A0A1H7TVW0_STRJI|nr:universal stress protein [Streptacidiphilus jiangxiensis]SEL88695.1 Nucleotide-binding universal stress protein, UspA family [Streptacidiphilus jiangxiensis]
MASQSRGSVVVGVSGSRGSLEALRVATREARTSQRPLVVVLAWSSPGGEFAQRRASAPSLIKLCEREAKARLARCFDEAMGGPPTDPVPLPFVVRGRPGPVLLEVADDCEDLLVVGAGERSWPGRLVHGATARFCLGRARCAILAVPPPPLLDALPRAARHRVPYLFDEAERDEPARSL